MTTLTIENFASAFPAVNALPYAQSAIRPFGPGIFYYARATLHFPR